jgi:hypothetical protein
VIDVEQHALRAFEQDAASARPRLVQRQPDRPREGQHEPGNLAQVRLQRLAIDRRFPEARAQRVVMRAQAIELRIEPVDMGEVADADRAAADLVLISRADAAPGGADLALARRVLAQPVEIAVDRQDQRAGIGEMKIVGRDRQPLPAQLLDLVAQRPGIEHHAVADDAQRAPDDAGREQRELVDLIADDERVAGIVPALEARHHVRPAGEPVDDLALALIAPLPADDGDVRQCLFLFIEMRARSRHPPPSLRGAQRRSNPVSDSVWIASLRSQ